MTPVSDNDRNKLIGLVVAVVAVFAFLVWRVIGATSPEKPGEVTKVENLPEVSGGGPAPSTVANPSPSGSVVEVVPSSGAGQVDPFREVVPSPGPNQPATTANRTNPPRTTPTTMQGSLPLALQGGPGTGPLIPSVGGDVPSESPRLTGVMLGNPPIGVFLIGTHDEVVRVGGILSNGYTVQSIRGRSAVLRNKKSIIRLTITSGKPDKN